MYNVSGEVYLPKAFGRNKFKLRLLKCSSVAQHVCYYVSLETVFFAMCIMWYDVVTGLYVERSVSAKWEAFKKEILRIKNHVFKWSLVQNEKSWCKLI